MSAGIFSSSSSSSSSAVPGFGGGPPTALGSEEIKTKLPLTRTNSGFLPTSICWSSSPVAVSITEILEFSRVATMSFEPSSVMPSPRGPSAFRSNVLTTSMVARSMTLTPAVFDFWLVT